MAQIEGVTSTDFCKWLLTDFSHNGKTLLIAPGSGFYKTEGLGEDEVRIAYVLKVPIIKEAVEVMGAAIAAYRAEAEAEAAATATVARL